MHYVVTLCNLLHLLHNVALLRNVLLQDAVMALRGRRVPQECVADLRGSTAC